MTSALIRSNFHLNNKQSRANRDEFARAYRVMLPEPHYYKVGKSVHDCTANVANVVLGAEEVLDFHVMKSSEHQGLKSGSNLLVEKFEIPSDARMFFLKSYNGVGLEALLRWAVGARISVDLADKILRSLLHASIVAVAVENGCAGPIALDFKMVSDYLADLLPRVNENESKDISLKIVQSLESYIRSGGVLRIDGGVLKIVDGKIAVEISDKKSNKEDSLKEKSDKADIFNDQYKIAA